MYMALRYVDYGWQSIELKDNKSDEVTDIFHFCMCYVELECAECGINIFKGKFVSHQSMTMTLGHQQNRGVGP